MLQAGDRATKDGIIGITVQTDPNTYSDFTSKMSSTDPEALTLSDIYQARAAGRLSDHDMNFILTARNRILSDPAVRTAHASFQSWLKGEKSTFTASNIFGGRDPVGDQNFADFSRRALTQFDQTYNAKGNWQSLIDPKSKDYLGHMASGYVGKGQSAPQTTSYQPGQADGGYVFTGGNWQDKCN